jgi:hypothetical protein
MSLKISRAARQKPIADSQGFCRGAAKYMDGKRTISSAKHPCHRRPRRRGNSNALVIPGPTVVECMQMVGLIVFDWGCEAFQPFLSRSWIDFGRF